MIGSYETRNERSEYRGDMVDVVHSPDDGGYYAQRWDDDAVSPTYETREELLAAISDGRDVEFIQPEYRRK